MVDSVNFQTREEQPAEMFAMECFSIVGVVELFVALSIRRAIAELAKVHPGQLRSSDRFKVELRNLPFWDDYENQIFVDQIVDIMGFALREKQYDKVSSPEFSGKRYTIAEFVQQYRCVLDSQQERLIAQMAAA